MTKTLVMAVALWDYSLKSPPKTFEAETIFTDLFDSCLMAASYSSLGDMPSGE